MSETPLLPRETNLKNDASDPSEGNPFVIDTRRHEAYDPSEGNPFVTEASSIDDLDQIVKATKNDKEVLSQASQRARQLLEQGNSEYSLPEQAEKIEDKPTKKPNYALRRVVAGAALAATTAGLGMGAKEAVEFLNDSATFSEETISVPVTDGDTLWGLTSQNIESIDKLHDKQEAIKYVTEMPENEAVFRYEDGSYRPIRQGDVITMPESVEP